MRVTKQTTWANSPLFKNVSFKKALIWTVAIMVGWFLFFTSVFKYNWLALIGYCAIISIILGETPTGRGMITNAYGVLFKKPIKMVVTDHSTLDTIGHGIREIEKIPDLDAPAHKTIDGNYKLVYSVTSFINQWSVRSDYDYLARELRQLFNIMEGGEGLYIIVKQDSDTSMLKLESYLEEMDIVDGDDFKRLSDRRKMLLNKTATSDIGKSMQQFAVLSVKKKNINRTINALKKSTRLIRASSYPTDVLLAAMGLEGGLEYCGEKETK